MNPFTRRYDLDWLRVIAFMLLILFHTGMMFNDWDWHIKNPTTSPYFEYVMIFLHQWRMPLLFLISGAAVWFALQRYTTSQFVTERFKRLLIPLVFGMFVIIPPQVFYERLFQGQSYDFITFYGTVLEFKPYPAGNFSWHHLWYIPYILVYSFLALPLFLALKTERGQNIVTKILRPFQTGKGLLLWFLPIAISEIILRPFWPDNRNNLISDWTQFTTMFILFCYGYVLASNSEIWEAIRQNRRRVLLLAPFSLSALYFLWSVEFEPNALQMAVYRMLRMANMWFWILAILGFGSKYLQRNNAFLKYANQAVYPFYIVHQTVTVILGYHMVSWTAGIPMKFFILALGTFGGSFLVYEIVKRSNLTRILFGLRPKPKVRKAEVAWRAETPALR
ncbi:acyltransferase family protein [bacterium]|nr:acyltransferase family protein [bacterium]